MPSTKGISFARVPSSSRASISIQARALCISSASATRDWADSAAWTTFSEVAEVTERAGQADRAAAARQRADALAPRLPHLRVTASGGTGVRFTLDGVALGSGLVDSTVPVDPGDHELGADAAGKKHWSARFHATEGASVELSVPELEPEVVAPAPPPPSPPAPERSAGWQTPTAVVAAGLGVVGLAVGSGFGIKAIEDWSTAKPGCSGTVCTRADYPYWHSAHAEGIASTVSLAVGATLVATGAVIWLARPRGTSSRVGVRPDGVVVIGGLFP
jgi:hypothetical protein